MGPVRMLLPLLRATAHLAPGPGVPLLGAALLHCAVPGWALLYPPPPARRSAWAQEAVALYRPKVEQTHPAQRHLDALSRALVVHAHTLVLAERYAEADTVVDAALGVPGARMSPALTACAVHARAQALVFGGRAEEAQEPARECVRLYRGSAPPARRDRGLGALPVALRTQGLAFAVLGRTAESVAVYLECAALLRAVSVRQLSRFLRLRAQVLVELAGGLRALGRYEEVLALESEAKDAVYGTIARFYPELVLPLRVRLLTDLAYCHSATGSPAAARTSADEAVSLARELADQPEWFAEALRCLGLVLDELAAYDEQLTTLTELAGLYTRLAADRPEAFEPLLADTLDDLARCHRRSGDHLKAVADTERAVAAYRRVGRHEDQLARILSNLSIRQQSAEDAGSAVSSAREAVALTRRLAESDSETHGPPTARRLRVLAQALGLAGDHAAAVAGYQEAEAVLSELIGIPGVDAELAVTVSALAVALDIEVQDRLAADRSEEAVAALRSLLDLTRRTDVRDVHARCVIAFARARAERPDDIDIVRAWERVVGASYPTFVYRRTDTRGLGAKPAAR
ncbi:tetratricopeptide repeat protein [Streptomyces sp. STR69]|uniref:tetratricopeptide repeat protein n=1 Tax=Streptomyces sp. STR69 TaxID=1796942 RepID=UPI0021C67D50|nr:tetratricopeptide repeat protein [Streptomyces sp. STR69]